MCDPIDSCPEDNPDDSDSDSVCDSTDKCEGFDDSFDADSDGVPDACDVCNGADSSGDLDSDGTCDNIDPDRDGDGVSNAGDNFPSDRFRCRDLDGDTCDGENHESTPVFPLYSSCLY